MNLETQVFTDQKDIKQQKKSIFLLQKKYFSNDMFPVLSNVDKYFY